MNVIEPTGDGFLMFDCPGCGTPHAVRVEGERSPKWEWNGSLESPTFSPSILVRWDFGPSREPKVCHSFVRDGRIEFLSDCTHPLAGQTVALSEVSP
jgi:hypothetical protein